MTLKDVDAFITEEFSTNARFVRWIRPVYCDGLTLTNVTTKNEPEYIRLIQISWKGDVVSTINFDHEIRKWSEGRRHIAFRIWKEIEKFNA